MKKKHILPYSICADFSTILTNKRENNETLYAGIKTWSGTRV